MKFLVPCRNTDLNHDITKVSSQVRACPHAQAYEGKTDTYVLLLYGRFSQISGDR